MDVRNKKKHVKTVSGLTCSQPKRCKQKKEKGKKHYEEAFTPQ